MRNNIGFWKDKKIPRASTRLNIFSLEFMITHNGTTNFYEEIVHLVAHANVAGESQRIFRWFVWLLWAISSSLIISIKFLNYVAILVLN